MTSDRYLAGVAEWRNPETEPPPCGTKLLLMNPAGVAVIGHWQPQWCLAWAPLPKKPEWLKEKMK
jgi:hypothetical protein